MKPLISILMPVLNCGEALIPAVNSIVEQSCGDWELLILDDGSTDQAAEIVARFTDSRIRWVASAGDTVGLAARLNQGVAMARGSLIARMDGDDISFPQRLEKELDLLRQRPEVDLVGCGMVIFKDSGELVGVQPARRTHEEICGNAFRSCLLPHATWMGRAAWFRENPYRETMRRAEDRDLLLRTRYHSCFAGIPEPLYGYRVNGISMRKNVHTRLEYLAAACSEARSRGDLVDFCTRGGVELAKLAIDTIAISTHTEKLLLRHRALPVADKTTVDRWNQLYASLHGVQPGTC